MVRSQADMIYATRTRDAMHQPADSAPLYSMQT